MRTEEEYGDVRKSRNANMVYEDIIATLCFYSRCEMFCRRCSLATIDVSFGAHVEHRALNEATRRFGKSQTLKLRSSTFRHSRIPSAHFFFEVEISDRFTFRVVCFVLLQPTTETRPCPSRSNIVAVISSDLPSALPREVSHRPWKTPFPFKVYFVPVSCRIASDPRNG